MVQSPHSKNLILFTKLTGKRLFRENEHGSYRDAILITSKTETSSASTSHPVSKHSNNTQ